MSGSAFVPADEDIRRHIREQVDTNMLVEAGAGTGKTTVLVERIAWILRTTDTRADELAVITFTEKAAAELASRVRQALEDARGAADITPEQSERVERALRDLNRAHIETIHAFAAGLLRERPVEAKLDPGFTVLDEMPSQLAFETAWSEWISGQMAEDPPPAALLDVLEMGLEAPRLRDAAEKLHSHRNLLPLGEFAMDLVDPAGFLDALEVQAAVLRGMNPRMKDLSDTAYVAIPDYLRWADEILALRGHEQTLAQAVAGSTVTKQPGGNQKSWVRADDCRATKAAEKAIYEHIVGYRSLLRQQATANLLRWLEGFVAFYGEQRRARGRRTSTTC